MRGVEGNQRCFSFLNTPDNFFYFFLLHFRLPHVPPPNQHLAIVQDGIGKALFGIVEVDRFNRKIRKGLKIRRDLVAEKVWVSLLLRGLLLVPDDNFDGSSE